jgi:hypothetical protein
MSAKETDLADEDAPLVSSKSTKSSPAPTSVKAGTGKDDDDEDLEDPPKPTKAAVLSTVAKPSPLVAAETAGPAAGGPGFLDSCSGDNKATTEKGTPCRTWAEDNVATLACSKSSPV